VPRLSGTPGEIRTPAPALGEHTYEVLIELGFGRDDVDHLVDEGVAIAS